MLTYLFSIIAAVGVVAIAALSFRLAGKGSDDRGADGPSAGHAGAMLSALFLVVFAIAIIVPWTTADAARQNTHAESRAVVDAYWAAAGLPADGVGPVRAGLRDYAAFVVRDEWPDMAQGKLEEAGAERLDGCAPSASSSTPTRGELAARGVVLDQLGASPRPAPSAPPTPPRHAPGGLLG